MTNRANTRKKISKLIFLKYCKPIFVFLAIFIKKFIRLALQIANIKAEVSLNSFKFNVASGPLFIATVFTIIALTKIYKIFKIDEVKYI